MTDAPAVEINLPGYPFDALVSVDTITALRARASTSNANGDNIAVAGSAAVGDGLGGVYVWSGASVADDDGSLTIRPSDVSPGAAGRYILTNGQIFAGPEGADIIGFVQDGTGAVNRTVQEKLREGVTASDFGADPTGVGNSATAFSDMFAASSKIGATEGTYKLNSSPSVGVAPFSWRADPATTFTGAGVISTPDILGYNYTPDIRRISLVEVRGTSMAPLSDAHAVGAFIKHTDSTSAIAPSFYTSAYKWNNSALAGAQGIYSEAIDKVGGAGGFIEGGRFHGINTTDGLGGNVYGLIVYAQSGDLTNDPNSQVVAGIESEVIRTLGTDAVLPRFWTSADTITACYLATSRTPEDTIPGTAVKPYAGFMVNPYNSVPPQVGFLVPKGSAARASGKSVAHTAFACTETGLTYGLDLAFGSYSGGAIVLPNNSAVASLNAAGNAEINIMFLATDNTLHLGATASGIQLTGALYTTGGLGNFANDAAASSGGVGVNQLYRNGSIVMVRVS